MNHTNQYQGRNPIPGPKRYGNAKNDAVVATGTDGATQAQAPAAAEVDAAKLNITSIDPKVVAKPDANAATQAANATGVKAPVAKVEAGVDPAKPDAPIVTDPEKSATSTRPTR
jgi:hypothetical protein